MGVIQGALRELSKSDYVFSLLGNVVLWVFDVPVIVE